MKNLNKRTVAQLLALLKIANPSLDLPKLEAALMTDEADETKHVDTSGEIIPADTVIIPNGCAGKSDHGQGSNRVGR